MANVSTVSAPTCPDEVSTFIDLNDIAMAATEVGTWDVDGVPHDYVRVRFTYSRPSRLWNYYLGWTCSPAPCDASLMPADLGRMANDGFLLETCASDGECGGCGPRCSLWGDCRAGASDAFADGSTHYDKASCSVEAGCACETYTTVGEPFSPADLGACFALAPPPPPSPCPAAVTDFFETSQIASATWREESWERDGVGFERINVRFEYTACDHPHHLSMHWTCSPAPCNASLGHAASAGAAGECAAAGAAGNMDLFANDGYLLERCDGDSGCGGCGPRCSRWGDCRAGGPADFESGRSYYQLAQCTGAGCFCEAHRELCVPFSPGLLEACFPPGPPATCSGGGGGGGSSNAGALAGGLVGGAAGLLALGVAAYMRWCRESSPRPMPVSSRRHHVAAAQPVSRTRGELQLAARAPRGHPSPPRGATRLNSFEQRV